MHLKSFIDRAPYGPARELKHSPEPIDPQKQWVAREWNTTSQSQSVVSGALRRRGRKGYVKGRGDLGRRQVGTGGMDFILYARRLQVICINKRLAAGGAYKRFPRPLAIEDGQGREHSLAVVMEALCGGG